MPVADLARSRRKYAIGTMLAVVVAAGLLALALVAAFDMLVPLPRMVRTVIALVGATGIATFIFAAIQKVKARHTEKSAAQAMEAAHPEIGQRIRTALEILQRGVPANAGSDEQVFAKAVIAESKESLRKHSWRSLIPVRQLAAWAVAAIAVAGTIFAAAKQWPDFRLGLARIASPTTAGTYTEVGWTAAPRMFDDRHPPRLELRVDRRLAEPKLFVREQGGEWVKTEMTPLPDGRTWDIVITGRSRDFEAYATAGDAQTATHSIAFTPIPKLVATQTTLNFPDYIGLPSETRKVGDVTALEGTKVRWDLTFNIPPKNVTWSIGAEQTRLATNGTTASTEWTATPGRTQAIVSVNDDAGETIEAWKFVVEGFADAMPTVELLEPVKDQEATNIAELPVRIRAKDDYGVAEVGLVLEAAGAREWVTEKVIDSRDQRSVSEIATAMLEKVPLTLRDNVRLYAYALDHKPRGGPRAVSPLRAIDIKQFKMRWIMQESAGGGGGANIPDLGEKLMKLGEVITKQRGVVSDTFVVRENLRASGGGATTAGLPIAQRESELAGKAGEICNAWIDEGKIPQDDIALLDTATAQMNEASGQLGLKGQADIGKGFVTADRSLSTLLQLRKRLITYLKKCNCDGDKPKEEDKIKQLAELAREAERIAREERDIRSQLAPEAAAGTNPDATRRQHEVATADAGELYSEIVDHPQTVEAAIQLMDEAEKSMTAGDKSLRAGKSVDAIPTVERAETRLMELAEFLRSLEMSQVAETLKKMGSKAEQNAACASPSPSDAGKKPGEKSEKAGREAELADKLLAALAEKAGAKKELTDKTTADAEKTLGETLAELRDQVGAKQLGDELKALADLQNKGEGKAEGEKAGAKLSAMAKEFYDAAARLEASQAAKLALAQALAKQLKEQLAKGEKPGDKPGPKPGDKPGLAKGDKPGEKGGEKPGDKPGDGKQPGDKPGSGLAKGDKPGDKPGEGEKPGDKPGKGIAKAGDKPGEGKGGEEPKDDGKPGKGGIAGDIEEAKNESGGQAMGRFSKALRSLGDDKLHELSIKLFKTPFSRDALPDVEAAAERIEQLIAELPASSAPVVAAGKVPEQRRREVEDYFRDLSDDFGDEQWDTEQPGQKTE